MNLFAPCSAPICFSSNTLIFEEKLGCDLLFKDHNPSLWPIYGIISEGFFLFHLILHSVLLNLVDLNNGSVKRVFLATALNLLLLWCIVYRPGFVRLNLPYFMSDHAVDFVLEAVKMVAEHGWKLLPQVNGTKSWFCFVQFEIITDLVSD